MKTKNNFFIALSFIFLAVLAVPTGLRAEDTTPTTTPVVTETITETETSTTTEAITTTTTENVSETVISENVKLTIRIDSAIVFADTVAISTVTTTVTDNQGAAHNAAGNSVLGMLGAADTASALFDITDLAYFASFDSFIINCIKAGETPSCYNWQYTVNDVYPFVGIDKYLLKNGDDVYLYFGAQNQFSLSTTTLTLGEPLTITAQKYDYRNNAWIARPGVTVGGTKYDPANPWTPIVVTSTVANDLGIATLYFTATGTLDIGISEDYYYPLKTVTIVDAIATTTTTETVTETTPPPTSSGGGGSSSSNSNNSVPAQTLDIAKAIEFLGAQQNQTTGAIGSASLYSDWAAIALGSYSNSSDIKTKLSAYLQTDPGAGTSATDFERRAMALMALGINPYSGTNINYINKILATYQNNQFGDVGLVNDDVFALFPLLKAGYTTADAEIQNAVAFIISRQNAAGGWESPDLTAAAVQALSQVKSLSGVPEALTKAKNYLKTSTKADGRIGDNSFSTSWGVQAIAALGESVSSWNGTNDSPLTYLAKQQQADGGLETTATTDNRIWSTSYAIPAGQNKVWSDILVSFSKPIVTTNPTPNSGTGGGIIIPVETPTSTPATTSTPVIITVPTSTTSTVEILVPNPEPTVTRIIEPIVTEPAVETVTEEITTAPVLRNSAPQPKLVVSTENAPVQVVANNTSEQLTIAPPQNTPVSNNRRAAGGAAAVAGTAAAYLAWRFLQSLV